MTGSPVPQSELAGQVVAITGRMASMTRDEAVSRLDRAGATYAKTVNQQVNCLVVGLDGWPLSRDGHLTQHLQRAEQLQGEGHSIDVLREDEFLKRLGFAGPGGEGVRHLYTLEQLCRILKIPRETLRLWVRQGLIHPRKTVHRLCYFDFEQVASAKVLSDLRKRGVTSHRIQQSLEQLKRWFPDAERSVAQLGILERSGHLLVRLGDGQLAEPTGQLYFDFADRDVAAAEDADENGPAITKNFYEQALQHEESGDLEAAADSYQEALLAGGPHSEIAFNLGNVLYGLGRRDAAAQRFAQAVELEPKYVEAWNNLGNTYGEMGMLRQAMRAYQRALGVEPAYADAHFNLAETLDQLGHRGQARVHWEEYLRLDPASSWARRVRARLEESDEDQRP